MQIEASKVQFNNTQNPEAKVDVVRLEKVLTREGLSHSPFEFHRLEFYILLFIEKGEGTHSIDFVDYDYKPGTVFTIRKGQLHKFHQNPDVRGTMLLFTDEFMVSYLDSQKVLQTMKLFNELLSKPFIQPDEKQQVHLFGGIERILSEYFEVNDYYSQEIIRSELHILVTKLFRINVQRDKKVFDQKYLSDFIHLQSLIEQNIHKTMKVKDYAEMMNRSTKSLNKISKAVVGRTAKEFVDDICIKNIKRLLINTTQTTTEIAYAMGFDETTNFYKYFKHRTKVTPEQFRHSF